MRHRVGTAKLKRDVGARNSLLKNLVTSVIDKERVVTTVPKAKAIKPIVDQMITLAKRDTPSSKTIEPTGVPLVDCTLTEKVTDVRKGTGL